MAINQDNLGDLIFCHETESTAAGLRFVAKKKQTLAQLFIRAYGSLGNSFAEVIN
jgi:hypothetical protein